MLYTFAGALIGATLAYTYCKVTDVNFDSDKAKLLSRGSVITLAGAIVGSSVVSIGVETTKPFFNCYYFPC